MDPLEKFLGQVNYIHGPGVAETSYYGALEALFNAVGERLSPPVLCVMQLKDTGAGIPDGGLFTATQFPRGADVEAEAATLLPERGAIEVKSPAEDARAIAQSDQVTRYLRQYRQVLVTNLRAFVLMGLDGQGEPVELETYTLAETAGSFWRMTAHPRAAANRHGERMAEYLRRVMLHAAPLATPKALADFLASYAKEARARVQAAMEAQKLRALAAIREALEETLGLHFQGRKGDHFFRATLVQTLFYGVFSAWVLWHHENPHPDARFDWRTAAYDLHVPVIGAIFERLALPSNLRKLNLIEVLNWTGTLLNRVDRETFFRRFEQERAVQYFYEPFLEAYDPELRKELGVWYTPPEVVEYMVARVDTVLREELELPDGLADPRVHVLDPCCGTGAYLVAVLERIAETLKQKRGDALWAHDLKEAAKTRVFGFELLPAPFVISHLQLGLMLQQSGVPLDAEERAAVYLTNALTGWQPPEEGKRQITAAPFQRERAAAERVKQEAPILVILGNPPYDSFADVAVGEERALSEAYRETREGPKPRGHGLNDLYVRFYRMAERRIVGETGQGPGRGIVSFISNYSWLDGLSHPGMRERYLEVFDRIWIDNLHGDRIISEYAPDGQVSETLFAIQGSSPGIKVGTAIALLTRTKPHGDSAELLYRDFEQAKARQRRKALLESLSTSDFNTQYHHLKPLPILGYPFKPKKAEGDYFNWPQLPEVFPAHFSGVETGKDQALVDIDRAQLIERMEKYFDPHLDHDEIAQICPVLMKERAHFNPVGTRDYLVKRGFLRDNIVLHAYRPFDLRWLYWEPETDLLNRNRPEYYPQVFDGNVWLVSEEKARRGYSPPHFIKRIGSRHLMEHGASCFPLYTKDLSLFGGPDPQPEPNLSDEAFAYLEDVGPNATPAQLFYHALATLHAPTYRAENRGALRQDWPRVPLPADAGTLSASAELGRRIADLLDPEAAVAGVTAAPIHPELQTVAVLRHAAGEETPLDPNAGHLAVTAGWGYLIRNGTVTMPGQGTLEERADGGYDLYLNEVACWRNVPADVWDYTLGGYPVLKKWLSYREKDVLGRDLRPAEARTFTEIARRIAALLAMEPELDANYRRARGTTYEWAG